jgi:hypothetical protein
VVFADGVTVILVPDTAHVWDGRTKHAVTEYKFKIGGKSCGHSVQLLLILVSQSDLDQPVIRRIVETMALIQLMEIEALIVMTQHEFQNGVFGLIRLYQDLPPSLTSRPSADLGQQLETPFMSPEFGKVQN